MIVIAGSVRIRPEQREEAVRAASKMAAATRSEAGCLAYRFYSDLEDANVFFIFEEWESEEALGRHFQTEHMKEFQRELPKILAGGSAIKRYVVESASPM